MDQTTLMTIMWATVIVVLIFDYTNGFHNASNITVTPQPSSAGRPKSTPAVPDEASAFTLITTPSHLQQEVFRLLQVAL